MRCLSVVFVCTSMLCAVFVLCLLLRQCFAPSLCCVCLYVSALCCLCVVFVSTLVLCAVLVLCLFVRNCYALSLFVFVGTLVL